MLAAYHQLKLHCMFCPAVAGRKGYLSLALGDTKGVVGARDSLYLLLEFGDALG